MFTSSTQSGNHGRSSAEPSPTGIGNLVPSTTPQQSMRGFVAPSSAPVKKTPDITDIIGESGRQNVEATFAVENVRAQNLVSNAEAKEEERKETEEVPFSNFEEMDGETERSFDEDKPIEAQPQPNEVNGEVSSSAAITPPQEYVPDFPTQWRILFEQIFSSVPTIYYSFKEMLPEIENNIVKVVVKNEIQKEHFEAKTRKVLEFLRTHFSEKVEDIIVEANEQLETKKIIYDVKDKLQNFKEQNIDFEDFIQILDLKIKD